jgi:hypothetical protein
MLDQFLIDSCPCTKTQDYKDLLDFVIRLPNLAPFKSMILPGREAGAQYVTAW